MNKRISLILIGLIAILGIVNATIYTYRWITGTVYVYGPDVAAKLGCVGFYATDQSGIGSYLPANGTNYNAPILGTGQQITVTPGQTVCKFPSSSSPQFSLYESIEVKINVTVGAWYIQDFYALGYYNEASTPQSIYVWLRLESSNMSLIATNATLIVYRNDSTGPYTLSLTESPGTLAGPIELRVNGSLRLDLYIDTKDLPSGQQYMVGTFKVGFYVTQENEAPRIP